MKSHPTTDPLIDHRSSNTKEAQTDAPHPSRVRELLLLLAALAFTALGVWLWSPWRIEPILRLRVAAGEPSGARYQMASALKDHLGKHRIELELVPSQGSEESLTLLDDRRIDLALVQGGLNLLDRKQVRQLSALQIEPLHVLVKEELEVAFREKGLKGLRGKRVFAGSPSSGTQVLTVNLLDFLELGIDPSRDPNSVILMDEFRSYEDLFQASADGMPDAIFHVSMVPSPVADRLTGQKGYRLVSVPYARAFTRSGAIEARDLNRSLVSECTIPAYTYGVSPDVPDRDLLTLGSRMLLVAHRDQTNSSVQRLLSAIFDPDLLRHTRLDLDPKSLELPSEYEVHPGVGQYRDRNKVLIASDIIDYMDNLLAIVATVAGALFFLYQWYAEHRRSERESRFAEFMTRVIAIEQSALNTEVASKLDLGHSFAAGVGQSQGGGGARICCRGMAWHPHAQWIIGLDQ